MFFRLPIDAEVPDWLGDWLTETFATNFGAIDNGGQHDISLQSLEGDQATRLQKRNALLKAVADVLQAYETLPQPDRDAVRQAFQDQCDIPAMLVSACTSSTRSMLPEQIRGPLDDLSKAAFSALADFGIRRASLAVHFDGSSGGTCGFCGYEPVDSGSPADPDWDHYLARSLYPFAAYSLRNLTPMGTACNRTYKGAKDVLRDADGAPRHCYDPYISGPIEVHLRNSDPFGQGSRPIYSVTIEGDADRSRTWNDVFRVEDRWLDQLRAKHESCLRDLASAFRREHSPSDQELEAALRARSATPPATPKYGDDLIRNAVFDHWLAYFTAGSYQRQRLGDLFRDVVAQRGRATIT